jgi:lysophospholipase L1-like esterase
MSNQKGLDDFIKEGRSPENKRYDCHILAEGDSWFNLGGILFPTEHRNLLDPLEFKKDTVIVNLAALGDKLKHMGRIRKTSNLYKALDLRKWDLMFVSGGGNDLIDALLRNYSVNGEILEVLNKLSTPAKDYQDYINKPGLEKFLGVIETCYIQLAGCRSMAGGKNKDTEIITHCYDYIQPRNAPAAKLFGPWVYKAMKDIYAIPKPFWLPIANHVFAALQETMVGLEKKIDKFHVLKTLGTLTLAEAGTRGNSNDWANEIHPNPGGYEKLARIHIQPLMDRILGKPAMIERGWHRILFEMLSRLRKIWANWISHA